MKRKSMLTIAITAIALAVLGGVAISAQDKYTVQVPGGLAFSEFRGYESWEAVSISRNEKVVAVILANPVMIAAYKAGMPGNGKPFPDGSKIAKIQWTRRAPRPVRRERAGQFQGPFLHREGQQEISGHRRVGVCAVQL